MLKVIDTADVFWAVDDECSGFDSIYDAVEYHLECHHPDEWGESVTVTPYIREELDDIELYEELEKTLKEYLYENHVPADELDNDVILSKKIILDLQNCVKTVKMEFNPDFYREQYEHRIEVNVEEWVCLHRPDWIFEPILGMVQYENK